jgi:hypothetical protein
LTLTLEVKLVLAPGFGGTEGGVFFFSTKAMMEASVLELPRNWALRISLFVLKGVEALV